MPKLAHTQNSFSSGELSQTMKGRTALAQYSNGCEELLNMVVIPQGGLTKRPGTQFIAEVKDSSKNTIILPFSAGRNQSYIMELGDNYIRFYRDGGRLLSTAAITNGTFGTDLTGWTSLNTGTGTSVQSAGVMRLNGGAAGVGARTQSVAYVGTAQHTLTFTSITNTCEYRIGTTSGGSEIASGTSALGANNINFTPAAAGTIFITFRNANNNDADIDNVSLNTPVYEINTPWTSSILNDLQYAQSQDTFYTAHGNVALRKIRRFGASQFDLVEVDLVDGPYFRKTHPRFGGVGTGFTITPSATSGTVTLTASGSIFASTDVGRAIRYRPNTSAEWSELTITAYTSPTQVTARVEKVLAGTTASTEWRLGAFSETTGYPACVTFHEQRLVLANTNFQPQTAWFSRSGDIEIFQPDSDSYKDEVDATTAMTYTLASREKNPIVWLSSRNVLFLGTEKFIFAAKASSLDEAMTPNNITIKPTEYVSAYKAIPIETSNATLYIQLHQLKIMELAYNVERDNMVAVDLNILASHIGAGKFKQIVRQEEPYNIIWAITEDGKLYGLTYIRDQQIVGWHRHELGGTDVQVKSIACIPGEKETELWMVVSRTINGQTKQFVEKLTQFFREDVADEDAFFVDSGLTYTGSATTNLSGLSHLEGQTVVAYANGYVGVVSAPVSTGSVTLQQSTIKAHVGLPYTAKVKTMPIEMQGPAGTLQGSLVRAWKSFIRFYRSALAKVGYSTEKSDIVKNFADGYVMGGSIPLFTGVKEIPFPKGSELEMATYVEQSQPAPLNILVIGTKLIVDDDR